MLEQEPSAMKPRQKHLFLFILSVMLSKDVILEAHPDHGPVPDFVRVYSGNQATIRSIYILDSNCSYFLTDRIFARTGSTWKKMDLPVAQNISLLSLTAKNIGWFTVNTEINTSDLYYFNQDRIEKIRSPFANEICAAFFPEKELGIFAGWGELAVYAKGQFVKIPPPPTLSAIIKVYGTNQKNIWLLNGAKELFHLKNNLYDRILPHEQIKDFCFSEAEHGFVLCESSIFEITGHQSKKIIDHDALLKVTRLAIIDHNDLWLIGENGLILNVHDGMLKKTDSKRRENLRDIVVSGQREIWITGEKGLILYSGLKKFPSCPENNDGFTKNRIYAYGGGHADDEYGVAIADFNSDNKKDIYAVCIFNPNRMYINYMDSASAVFPAPLFKDEAVKRGSTGFSKNLTLTAPSELHLGVAAGDIDNDGDQDIYLCSLNGKNKLLINNGKGWFRDVSDQKERGCEDLKRSNTAALSDVDNDGDLDLFVTSENGSNKLYLNDGTGHFKDVTARAGLSSVNGGMCASFSDINGDGLPDLCVSFWFSKNKLYLNESKDGHVKFRDITALTDLSKAEPVRSNAVVFADINNDGSPDLFIANRNSPNKLYLNDGKGLFRDVSASYFSDKTFLSNGAVFADFDLDGYQDLYLANVGENILFKNVNGKYFVDATDRFGAELSGYCTGCATGDIDNDGDLDLYVSNYINGNSLLFINDLEQIHSVTFVLQGTKSNRDAIGAQITLYTADPSTGMKKIAGYREINGGSGYGSLSAKEAVLGLDPRKTYAASIRFPASGKTIEVENIHSGDRLQIVEESGFPGKVSLEFKAMKRFFIDNENQMEIFKYLLVLGLMVLSLYFQRHRQVIPAKTLFFIYLPLFLMFFLVNRAFLYETLAISLSIPVGMVLFSLVILQLFSERILLKRKVVKEKQEIRESISRDLHDDLASTLGSISIYANMMKENSPSNETNRLHVSHKIAELSQKALQSITDIIWITTPKHDLLKSLLSKIRNYYFELFNDNKIRFSSEIEMAGKDAVLTDKFRHNIFLILKEVANNIIRHSKADRVFLKAGIEDGCCSIEVADNGCGFDADLKKENASLGNGLINISRRAEESGIQLEIHSEVGSGTQITLTFKIAQTGH